MKRCKCKQYQTVFGLAFILAALALWIWPKSDEASTLKREPIVVQVQGVQEIATQRSITFSGVTRAKHRAVLALRYFDELTYDEIAQTLNIPLGTVKSRLNVAIKNLRKQMLED